ncbi:MULTISPECIES: tautomerase family protein [Marinobacter]|uniref:tautomerase family protein n=1 Tax=Marinobacter TaxID=2742 RepID=UPI001D08B7B9|nr:MULTISPECIES: tautomerase family protein [Marinobacter]MCK7568632.1 tautomerase family protein [Marinobacter xestospongiae]UDL07061.1 hypothetical protein J2887_10055 [Marinobacter sp. CA1]
MPLYMVSTQASIPVPKRQELASLIMNVHCGITGAPETFVNVLFMENVPLAGGITLNIIGNVRKGRTGEMNNTLRQEQISQISELMRVPEHQMELSLFEVPASWIMEGGEVLPEPGEEDQCQWLQAGHNA